MTHSCNTAYMAMICKHASVCNTALACSVRYTWLCTPHVSVFIYTSATVIVVTNVYVLVAEQMPGHTRWLRLPVATSALCGCQRHHQEIASLLMLPASPGYCWPADVRLQHQESCLRTDKHTPMTMSTLHVVCFGVRVLRHVNVHPLHTLSVKVSMTRAVCIHAHSLHTNSLLPGTYFQ